MKCTQTALPSGLVRQTNSGLGPIQSANVRVKLSDAAKLLFLLNILLLSQNTFKILQSITCSYTFWSTLVIDCGDPGTPWHGYLHGSYFHFNSKVTFSCRPQHHLEGDKQRTCQVDGQWSGEQPKCLGE